MLAEQLLAQNKLLQEQCINFIQEIESLREQKQKTTKTHQEELNLLHAKIEQLIEYNQNLEMKINENLLKALDQRVLIIL